ncbi:MAG: AEC family transporter [Clostridia bacterium]|nr:AEC family transporter [Clostridia bacterium]
MSIFSSTLNQIIFLFGFIAIGYLLVKIRVLPENTAAVLSKLENTVFIPALVAGTFIENFTVERISSAVNLLFISTVVAIIAIPFAIIVSKAVTKDKYIQKIYTYGLSFSNFGFMGNAVVSSLFPDVFFEYLIFTLPLWILIYLWGVPRLLIADNGKKQSFRETLKSFVNPMFIAMLIGMVIGLAKIPLPSWLISLISTSGNCMSPIAMILTGVVVSSISLKKTFTNIRIYIISFVRLVVMPLIFIAAAMLFEMSENAYICALCSLAMPLGLNTIVIPSALGKDTTDAAGMAVISHLMSVITIPVIFLFSC